ncbi:MAG: rRNA maturation RNase YbeY [Dysgonamonadaceae bacterium]|jgi:rRNA maturation RNase YbeY|nr:rRNA maturation RNase YbeY [Dysgonamonadaceae bacterium]
MAFFFETSGTSFPPCIKRRETARWIKHTLARYQKKAGAITYVFCSDEEILRINQQYLKHDYYTDIITFDYSAGHTVSGDLFISLDTVKSNSEKYRTDYTQELRRVMIHGILHLCGFNDKSPAEAVQMREKEDEALTYYGI